jgi:hypothetical protein
MDVRLVVASSPASRAALVRGSFVNTNAPAIAGSHTDLSASSGATALNQSRSTRRAAVLGSCAIAYRTKHKKKSAPQ